MIPTQTFESFPEFANSGTKTAPGNAKYAAGFIAADVLPAEWLNYFLAGATKGITNLNSGITSIEKEINNLLTERGIDPSVNETNQLLTALKSFKLETVLAAHPVGSLYWTSSSENPAVTFGGGTWVRITDRFILAAGNTYTNGNYGGNATITLTTNNIPSHTHTYSGTTSEYSGTTGGTSLTTNSDGGHTHNLTQGATGSYNNGNNPAVAGRNSPKGYIITNGAQYAGSHTHSINAHTHSIPSHTHSFSGTTSATGSGSAVNILPPYVVKYCWERTA